MKQLKDEKLRAKKESELIKKRVIIICKTKVNVTKRKTYFDESMRSSNCHLLCFQIKMCAKFKFTLFRLNLGFSLNN